ncbi:hypothetical protein GJ744_008819 [Endocarpon pusillum]|uniref:Uncharacterized protein n=1 Tax=Endocarpon pusillum TaxID=364733 RepID=A0A8H7AQC5_9EURO|nr:hypothetical protein GJ744_008819 [Endocarpon pusillum]
MGAYVSKGQCERFHSVSLNCSLLNATTPYNYTVVGGIHHREFEPNPDVAGIGILFAFFSVAALALLISLIYLLLQTTKFMHFTGVDTWVQHEVHQLQETSEAQERHSYRTTWADIFEGLILSCSDQQVFTSGAYALTLRYAQGCKISAYHYNIVANMMLITCATHLISITVVSQYWKHKMVAAFRIALITGLYIVTALLLSNQNASEELVWPTETPRQNETDTLLVLPAACFQSEKGNTGKTFGDTFSDADHLGNMAIRKSTPSKSRIVGWNFFILMILWYGAVIIAEVWRFWLSWYLRRKVHNRFPKLTAWIRTTDKWIKRFFWVYQFAGTSFCIVAITKTFLYIWSLRSWMNNSPWLRKEQDETNPENDATSFGQLVPLLLTLLTVFTALQLIGDKLGDFWNRVKKSDTEAAQNYGPDQQTTFQGRPGKQDDTTSQGLPQKVDYTTSPARWEKTDGTTVQANSIPPTPIDESIDLQHPRTSTGPSPRPSPRPLYPQ